MKRKRCVETWVWSRRPLVVTSAHRALWGASTLSSRPLLSNQKRSEGLFFLAVHGSRARWGAFRPHGPKLLSVRCRGRGSLLSFSPSMRGNATPRCARVSSSVAPPTPSPVKSTRGRTPARGRAAKISSEPRSRVRKEDSASVSRAVGLGSGRGRGRGRGRARGNADPRRGWGPASGRALRRCLVV